jgi:misacylated tRNA(Ala) deacylase
MRYFCHEQPDLLQLTTHVVESRPGIVLLEQSPFHPGGGGQLADRGRLRWSGGEVIVASIRVLEERQYHVLAEPVEISGAVDVFVDAPFRALMSALHTGTHVLNALVFQRFHGALVTGAQMHEDGTARMDFDLPEVDSDRLRSLEAAINDVIREDLPIRYDSVPMEEARAVPGLIRSLSVTPPPGPDGRIRIVEITGLDRQGCGGTHLRSTGESRPIRILKIDNKGRRNRRVRLGFAAP